MNVTDFWDGIRNNPGNPVFERHKHECFQGSYLSQRNNWCSIGRLVVQNRGGIETNGWGSRYLDYNYHDEEHTNRVNPVWRESHLDVQTDRSQEKYFPGIAGVAFINHVSEIRWISTRGGSRDTSDWLYVPNTEYEYTLFGISNAMDQAAITGEKQGICSVQRPKYRERLTGTADGSRMNIEQKRKLGKRGALLFLPSLSYFFFSAAISRDEQLQDFALCNITSQSWSC